MRFSFRSAGRLAAFTVAVGALTGCMMFMRAPSDLDYSRTRTSAHGLYTATIKPAGDSTPQGKLQTWTLRLTKADGSPVDSATITVDGGMPQHGHGLPTKPVVTRRLGNGEYVVEGIKFNMGGWWVVKFRVDGAAEGDSVVFNLKV